MRFTQRIYLLSIPALLLVYTEFYSLTDSDTTPFCPGLLYAADNLLVVTGITGEMRPAQTHKPVHFLLLLGSLRLPWCNQ